MTKIAVAAEALGLGELFSSIEASANQIDDPIARTNALSQLANIELRAIEIVRG